MQLSPKNAIEKGLVKGRDDSELNPEDYEGKSSIDLDVRSIIYKSDRSNISECDRYTLESQEMACLISEQVIDVQPGYVAYVFLKNRLSSQGLLAFNTGIVDSGFNGPISTYVTNFSKESIPLGRELPLTERYFFRVVFHKIDFDSNDYLKCKERKYLYHKYVSDQKRYFRLLPKSFLDRDKLQKTVRDEVNSTSLSRAAIYAGIFALGATFFTVVIPPLAADARDYFYHDFDSKLDKVQTELKAVKAELEELKKVKSNN